VRAADHLRGAFSDNCAIGSHQNTSYRGVGWGAISAVDGKKEGAVNHERYLNRRFGALE